MPLQRFSDFLKRPQGPTLPSHAVFVNENPEKEGSYTVHVLHLDHENKTFEFHHRFETRNIENIKDQVKKKQPWGPKSKEIKNVKNIDLMPTGTKPEHVFARMTGQQKFDGQRFSDYRNRGINPNAQMFLIDRGPPPGQKQ